MKRKYLVFYISLLELVLREVLVLKQISDNYLIKQKE